MEIDLYNIAQAGWLTDFTNWLLEAFKAIFREFMQFAVDLFFLWLANILDMWLFIIQQIPVPSFLTTYNLTSLLGPAGPTIAWLMTTLRIGEGLSIIGAGYAFRLTRKFVTLFQW